MSTTVIYNNSTIGTLDNQTKKLDTAGTWLVDDVTLVDQSSGSEVLVVDTLDEHGGTIRQITAQDAVYLQGQKQVTLSASPSTVSPDTGYDGFESVVVPSGYTIDQICAVNFPAATGDVVVSATSLRTFLFYGNTNITSFTGNNITYAKGDNYGTNEMAKTFQNCTNLVSVSMPKLNDLYHTDYLFSGCTKLETLVLDWSNMIRLGTGVFQNCQSLTKTIYVLPKLTTKIYSYVLTNNPYVTTFDICITTNTSGEQQINGQSLEKNSSLNTLIIRSTNYIIKLANINAFTGTPFASGGTGGTLYVPQSLISNYESATNWSTILGYANNSIEAIEGSYYETHYADGTTIPTT